MQLYVGSSTQFVKDNVQNQIAEKLEQAFFDYYGRRPPRGERMSWTNSLKAMALVINDAGLHDNGVLLEYQLPMASKRIDCMLTGHDEDAVHRAVIVELKQWETCELSNGEYVVTWVAGGNRDVLHPSVQSKQYRDYLADSHTAFNTEARVELDACAYLHNYAYQPGDPLLDPKYAQFRDAAPLFSRNDVGALSGYLGDRLGAGNGGPILNRVLESAYRPSKSLMNHVAGVIRHNDAFVLLDEQLVVYDKIRTILRTGLHRARKHVVLVRGGPGTGKSAIALNVMADLLEDGYTTHYATGSKAFTETLRKIMGSRSAQMFRYFNSYMDADPGAIDVLVADEAHRIRKTSDNRWTPRHKRTGRPQVEEILEASKVSVFFVDDHQVISPTEIGSSDLISEAARAFDAEVHEFKLDVQFRCGGSDAFIQWVNNTLGIQRTAQVLWEPSNEFEFRIFDTVQELDDAIRGRAEEGFSARLTAGFCWPWSSPLSDGTLKDDVVLGEYRRPWNAKPNARTAKGIPPAPLWAYDPGGIEQIGCIYTAQGFDFDYVGVIVGKDLVYDPRAAQWVGQKSESADAQVKRSGEAFTRLVKNAYRVLMTRGLKGCYVHFMDEDTANFVRSRVRQDEQG